MQFPPNFNETRLNAFIAPNCGNNTYTFFLFGLLDKLKGSPRRGRIPSLYGIEMPAKLSLLVPAKPTKFAKQSV